MSLAEKLQDDLKDALRRGDKNRVGVIRLILSRTNYLQIDKGGTLADSDVLGAITKEAEQRRESIEAFQKGNRSDLVAREQAELEVLLTYLPEKISPAEVESYARKVIAEVGATGVKDKGKVMPRLIAELKGRAEGKLINEVVTRLLSQETN